MKPEIVLNGKIIANPELTCDRSIRAELELQISGSENTWNLVLLRDSKNIEHIQIVASPIYFRNETFKAPRVYKIKIE